MKKITKRLGNMLFKDIILYKKRHGQVNHPNKVIWAIKLSLQLWEFMVTIHYAILNVHIIDPAFKKSHFANDVL